ADGFAAISRGRLPGCVMAIDGLAVQTRQPFAHEADGNVVAYRNRKGFWAVIALAGCGSRGKFLMFSEKTSGASNDCTAWEATEVYDAIVNKRLLPSAFYVTGDEAFVADDQVLTPKGRSTPR